ncbi:[protein-PII] uridylyltransferase [Haloechinothrix halophila]|uniref:[protein-PII] uridylyltransferase n=1 Tax=Haloechinothrix halophila TaxID=1069073 RepID=UPI000409616F|nr:[protein-PII] uridylyltransferase [Haloechinothrix halophila]
MIAGELVEAAERLLGSKTKNGRLGAAALRAALVNLYEFWLGKGAAAAGVDTDHPGVALVAVGGLGREELVPYSDLDLVLVHTGTPGIAEVADALWYPLWDARVGLDHSVRTTSEALAVARKDLRTQLGLLDARYIAGDADLAASLATAAREQWQRTARKRIGELADSVRERWRRTGDIGQSAEPDLKYGGGGLRDLGLLDALSAAQLIDRPGDELDRARTLLLDVRTELRLELRRDRDVLGAPQADKIAATLGFDDRFTLARELAGAGRAVRYAVDVALRANADAPKRAFGLRAARKPLDEGVVLHGNEVALAKGALPAKDPALLLRVASSAARTGKPITYAALRTLADSAPELRSPWPAEARHELTALLGAGGGFVDAVEALDNTGLWARLFPEWGAVRDLPPREPVHRWTVDRHLVQTCVEASALTTTVSRPDLLVLGALLHDIGKGRGTDHSELGAAITAEVARRIGFGDDDVEILTAMVRHHLLLPHTALRRDISEPETVQRVVATLDENPVLLELLHALAKADALATGPGVWSEWRAGLLRELVARCKEVMRGRPLVTEEPLDDRQRMLAETAKSSGRSEVLVTSEGNVATIAIAAPPGGDLLAPAAGALALQSLEVHQASSHVHAGVRVGLFNASPRFGTPPDPALLREKLARAVSAPDALGEQLASKERDYGDHPQHAEPRVLWFDEETEGADTVLLELRATDRIGLLYRVADALRSCDAEVRWARVATLGASCVDSFALRPKGGRSDVEWRKGVEKAVLAAASGQATGR